MASMNDKTDKAKTGETAGTAKTGTAVGEEVVRQKPRHASIARRNAARLAAIQTLYQHRFTGGGETGKNKLARQTLAETMAHYEAHFLPALLESLGLGRLHADMRESHYRRLLLGLAGETAKSEAAKLAEVDAVIGKHLGEGWRLGRLPALEVDTLRLAVVELQTCADVPARVVIAEYAAIAAEAWGADARYVTAVLDKIAFETRPGEMEGGEGGEASGEEGEAKPREMGEGEGG